MMMSKVADQVRVLVKTPQISFRQSIYRRLHRAAKVVERSSRGFENTGLRINDNVTRGFDFIETGFVATVKGIAGLYAWCICGTKECPVPIAVQSELPFEIYKSVGGLSMHGGCTEQANHHNASPRNILPALHNTMLAPCLQGEINARLKRG